MLFLSLSGFSSDRHNIAINIESLSHTSHDANASAHDSMSYSALRLISVAETEIETNLAGVTSGCIIHQNSSP
jgi:hypothetical protein